MRKRILISGPVLLGFCSFFDESWGKPSAEPLPGRTAKVIVSSAPAGIWIQNHSERSWRCCGPAEAPCPRKTPASGFMR